jgi:hypothetical protein
MCQQYGRMTTVISEPTLHKHVNQFMYTNNLVLLLKDFVVLNYFKSRLDININKTAPFRASHMLYKAITFHMTTAFVETLCK